MEESKCAHCTETAKYQCLKDNQYACSQHCREHHLRHKFQSITEEYARRSALYTLFQRDISTLSQGLGLDRNFIERFEQKAEEVTKDYVESLEEWIAVHRKQLLDLRHCAQTCDKSALLHKLVARLQANYAKPLLQFQLVLGQKEES